MGNFLLDDGRTLNDDLTINRVSDQQVGITAVNFFELGGNTLGVGAHDGVSLDGRRSRRGGRSRRRWTGALAGIAAEVLAERGACQDRCDGDRRCPACWAAGKACGVVHGLIASIWLHRRSIIWL